MAQVTQIELRLGVRLNVGDYQGVNAEVCLKADLDPREDDSGVFDQLRRTAAQQLAAAVLSGHPNSVRQRLDGVENEPVKQITNGGVSASAETPKRTRRTKEQIAADEAAAAAKAEAERKRMAEAQLGETANLGGDGDEGPGLGEDDSTASMLGDDIADEGPAVTREVLKAALGKLAKTKGSPALAKILQDFKVTAFPELKEEQYGAVYKAAEKAMA